jgi:Phage integrase, N-terminal SAM-like domain
MTSSQTNASPLRQRMTDDMRMRQLSPKTQDTYLRIVREFARFLGRSPDTATVEDLRRYQLHLVDRGTSTPASNTVAHSHSCGQWQASINPKRTRADIVLLEWTGIDCRPRAEVDPHRPFEFPV